MAFLATLLSSADPLCTQLMHRKSLLISMLRFEYKIIADCVKTRNHAVATQSLLGICPREARILPHARSIQP